MKAGAQFGQSWRVAGSKSAPFGQTGVCASLSSVTLLNNAGSRSGPYSSPRSTGSKSTTCPVPSSKATRRAYGAMISNAWTRNSGVSWHSYFSGSIGVAARPECSRFQSANSSSWCNSAQASTSRRCFCGIVPAIRSIGRDPAEQANDLAVRWNCKAGKCGSCPGEIDGTPKLMCMTQQYRRSHRPLRNPACACALALAYSQSRYSHTSSPARYRD